ncbi:hypothetical protein A2U01_0057373, partial [Trifolium medium]|nr:hypothetical protein [Trifolium medium]
MGVGGVGGEREFVECSASRQVWPGGGGCGLVGALDRFGGWWKAWMTGGCGSSIHLSVTRLNQHI